MPVYFAMLRGINVSGHNTIKMENLRAALAALGFGEVKTYIQSGNIVFQTANASPAVLAEKIAKKFRLILASPFPSSFGRRKNWAKC